MCVSLIKEFFQIYWMKLNLFKYFELYVHAYISDHFNGKHFCCSEPLQAYSFGEASGTPRRNNLNVCSRLTYKEVANLLASLQPTCNAQL